MPEVFPITMTQIDWKTYLRVCTEILKRSPTKEVDSAGMLLKGPAPFIASLSSFQGMIHSPSKVLKDAGYLLNHVSFGFLVSATDLTISTMGLDGLDVCCADGLAIVTATLYKWREVIIDVLSNSLRTPNPEYREVLNRIIGFFEQAGLAEPFAGYRRKSTGLLERIP